MSFGFSSSYKGRVPVGKNAPKKTPNSVQAIIDRAAQSAAGYLPNYGTPGAASPVAPYQPGMYGGAPTNNPVSPISQTTTSPNPYGNAYGGKVSQGAGGVSASSGGGAANAPGGNSTGLGSNGTSAYSGFMSQFTPGTFQNEVYNDPQIVLNKMWQDAGLNTSSPLYSTLRNLNGADPMSLFLLTNPGQTAGSLDAQAYGNFLHNLWQQQMTPGGRTVSFNEALANLNGAGNQSGLSPDHQSALYQQLSQGTAPQQFRTYYGLAQDAAKMGLPPSIASAFLDALARQGDTYLANSATGGTSSPFFQYAQNPMG